MKGWVYIISNKAMPGLIKIGYSTKDPEVRAEELNHTGTPHPYVVDYEMLVEGPFEIEQKAHALLSNVNEGKEWFRCDAEHAILAIKSAAGTNMIVETYKNVERLKVESAQFDEQRISDQKARNLQRQRQLADEIDKKRRAWEESQAKSTNFDNKGGF